MTYPPAVFVFVNHAGHHHDVDRDRLSAFDDLRDDGQPWVERTERDDQLANVHVLSGRRTASSVLVCASAASIVAYATSRSDLNARSSSSVIARIACSFCRMLAVILLGLREHSPCVLGWGGVFYHARHSTSPRQPRDRRPRTAISLTGPPVTNRPAA